MQEKLQGIVQAVQTQAPKLQTQAELESFKAQIVGPKGTFTQACKTIGQLPPEERPAAGQQINAAKEAINALLAQILERIDQAELQGRLGPAIDPTLPASDPGSGTLHPLTQVREEVARVFRKVGFTLAEGSEIETDHYCFEALNIPADHPARDMQDTYYLPEDLSMANVARRAKEPYLLRTHTSTVQIRTLLSEPPPLRILAPGRCFRRDTTDATHSANFHQIEGLYVDRCVTIQDLKAVLDYWVRELFSADAELRLRPSFFPFTEPSFEMDIRAPNLGKLSNQWIEILGCGLVDPAVFEAVELDPQEWTGYAFGIGIERLAMLLYGVDDIRLFYQNDQRFLRQFA